MFKFRPFNHVTIFSLVSTAITQYTYSLLGDGYCDDWVYLPEGRYPGWLNSGNELHDDDPKQECLNRCLSAYEARAGSSGKKIGNKAFYVNADGRCACAVGACSSRVTGLGQVYDSYEIIPGKL